jgi:hypothetical protein
MSEDEERVLLETDTFLSSQVSFDIDEPLKPAHRKASSPSSRRPSKQPNPEESEDELVGSCPGCGADIEESEFVEAILSFVTGAADYLGGDPVRVRSVQMLQQIISSGRLPDPHSEWTLEVVQRIEQHIEHMADERARLIRRQEWGTLEKSLRFEIEKKVREELADTIRAEVEQDIVGEVAVAIRDQVRKQTMEEMVPLIRADLEKELWSEFEAAMRAERAKSGGADEAE